MGTIDWIVFCLFIGYVVWDGVRRRSSADNLEGYYAGSRRIPWWAAGLSIMATQASAITVIGTTGQGHEGGMGFVQSYFGLPFAMVLLCMFLVPYYRSRNVLTPYQLLEALAPQQAVSVHAPEPECPGEIGGDLVRFDLQSTR